MGKRWVYKTPDFRPAAVSGELLASPWGTRHQSAFKTSQFALNCTKLDISSSEPQHVDENVPSSRASGSAASASKTLLAYRHPKIFSFDVVNSSLLHETNFCIIVKRCRWELSNGRRAPSHKVTCTPNPCNSAARLDRGVGEG